MSITQERLLTAYYDEIDGFAFFTSFVEKYNHSNNKNSIVLWKTLAQVEQRTASLLLRELYRTKVFNHDDNQSIVSTIERQQKELEYYKRGISDSEPYINQDWNTLMTTLTNYIEPYEVEYRQWYSSATQYEETFQALADHETALLHCFQFEQRGESGVHVLNEFLTKHLPPESMYQNEVENVLVRVVASK